MCITPARCVTFAAWALTALLPAHAAGMLELKFIEAEKFSDIGRSSFERDRNLKTLTDYLQTLAAQLPDGRTLQLDVLNVDLAGEVRPGGGQEIRVLRGAADWPQMKLRYTLTQNGAALKSGDAQLSDLGYLDRLHGQTSTYGDLPYDKRMLQDWFRKTFLAP